MVEDYNTVNHFDGIPLRSQHQATVECIKTKQSVRFHQQKKSSQNIHVQHAQFSHPSARLVQKPLTTIAAYLQKTITNIFYDWPLVCQSFSISRNQTIA